MTQPERILSVVVCTGAFLLLPTKGLAQSGTVTEDGFLSANATTQKANANGLGASLIVAGSSAVVGTSPVGKTTSYIKFDLAQSLPQPVTTGIAGNVAKATLKLFISPSCNPTGSIDVYPITSDWTESTLNPASPPSLAAERINSAPIPVGKGQSFLIVDITEQVQDWLEDPATSGSFVNRGIALVASTPTTNVTFDSKENPATSHEPRLEIVLNNSGPAGQAATVQVGSTTTLGPGSQASVTNSGTSSAAVLNFSIPQGPQGATGQAGAAGQAATVQVGTTMTVPATTPASVLNGSNNPSVAILNFLIPQGAKGDTGATGLTGLTGPQGPAGISNKGNWNSATAYNPSDSVFASGSYWLAASANTNSPPAPNNNNWQLLAAGINNRGPWDTSANYNANDAVTDAGSYWLALASNNASEPAASNTNWQLLVSQGAKGDTGAPGAPGAPGTNGINGAPGLAATVSVGTTTTGAPGTDAQVVNVGTPGAAVLNFTIPQGQAGSGGSNDSSLLSAFLPGALTKAYTAASFVPSAPITVTRISAALKTAPDSTCNTTVLRLGNGSTGQDIHLTGGQSVTDSGAMSLPVSAGTALNVDVQRPASCPQTNPADANVLVQYRGQQQGDTQICAASGKACNGICGVDTQNDLDNCGACGNSCTRGTNSVSACTSGTCSFACNQGLTRCDANSGNCVDLITDVNNCGTCGHVCPQPAPGTGAASCDPFNGGCSIDCNQGFDQCGNSCLAESDPHNCGGGCTTCPTGANGTSSCVVVDPCAGVTDPNSTCTANPYYACSAFTCSAGFTMCSGACVNTSSDGTNCGGCGNVCGNRQVCNNGQCQAFIGR